MSELVRVERDMRGRLRVAGPRRQELLCDLLETDVRDYVPYINALTEAIAADSNKAFDMLMRRF